MSTKKPEAGSMKVIVIRQPWAWLIVHGYKDIENRSWRTRYRGTLLIQASANLPPKCALEEDAFVRSEARGQSARRFREGRNCRAWSNWRIVSPGAEANGSRDRSAGFSRRQQRIPLIPLKGRLGLFDPPHSLIKRLSRKSSA